MPCRSEYMEQNDKEVETQLVCKLLEFILEQHGEGVPDDIGMNAKAYYPDTKKLDEYTAELCSTLGNMSKGEMDRIVYNGRNKTSRMLADWWEKHQEFDKERKKDENNKILKHLQAALDAIGEPLDSNIAEAIQLIENAKRYFEKD